MNTERDTYNQIEYARESGREEGRKEGKEEGRGEERLKIAMNLIRVGASCEIISQATTGNQIALIINALQNWLWHRPAQRPVNT